MRAHSKTGQPKTGYAAAAFALLLTGLLFGQPATAQEGGALGGFRNDPGKPIEVAVQADDSSAQLSVTEHGIGIAPEDQDRIFEEFYIQPFAKKLTGR